MLVQGAEPLFFLDYVAVNKLDPEQVSQLVAGLAPAVSRLIVPCWVVRRPSSLICTRVMISTWPALRWALLSAIALSPGNTLRVGDSVIGLASSGFTFQRLFPGSAHMS